MHHKIHSSLASLMLAVSVSVAGCGGEFAVDEDIGTSSEAVMTAFDPAVHGLRFDNDMFRNNFINAGGIEVNSKGLCGGMVYSTLDYYRAGKARPPQNYEPTTGTALRNHLYARQVDSLESNVDKWAEIIFNPFGWRDSEFFKWGLQKDARVKELRAAIDAGKPVPLGMKAIGSFTGGHQVLAIGYTLGAYDAAWLGYPNMKIMVYDPDYPDEVRTLVPNLTGNYWMDQNATSRRWLTYFVDANYTQVATPNFTSIEKGMVFRYKTGGDDLQGGSNNIDLTLVMKNGERKVYPNINSSDRWVEDSEESYAVALSNPNDVATVEFRTLFNDRWLSTGNIYRNINNFVLSTPRSTRIFDPAVHYGLGLGGIPVTYLTLPRTIVRALDANFDNSKDDSQIIYRTWGGAHYCAEIRNNTFYHAPYTNNICVWKNGHEDNGINYLSWNGLGDEWNAKLNGKTFTHTIRNGSRPPHTDIGLNYMRNSEKWQFRMK
jgi:hypothetical protein